MRTNKSLSIPVKELKLFDKDGGKARENICKNTLKYVSQDLEAVERRILEIIKDDPTLKRLFQISTSVSGIGTVTAGYAVVK